MYKTFSRDKVTQFSAIDLVQELQLYYKGQSDTKVSDYLRTYGEYVGMRNDSFQEATYITDHFSYDFKNDTDEEFHVASEYLIKKFGHFDIVWISW